MTMYAVQAWRQESRVEVLPSGAQTSLVTRHLPTFFLDSEVQGVASLSGAHLVAMRVVGEGFSGLFGVHVEEVSSSRAPSLEDALRAEGEAMVGRRVRHLGTPDAYGWVKRSELQGGAFARSHVELVVKWEGDGSTSRCGLTSVEVAPSPARRCYCPDDCGCRMPWRTSVCGCREHEEESSAPVAPSCARPTEDRHGFDRISARYAGDNLTLTRSTWEALSRGADHADDRERAREISLRTRATYSGSFKA